MSDENALLEIPIIDGDEPIDTDSSAEEISEAPTTQPTPPPNLEAEAEAEASEETIKNTESLGLDEAIASTLADPEDTIQQLASETQKESSNFTPLNEETPTDSDISTDEPANSPFPTVEASEAEPEPTPEPEVEPEVTMDVEPEIEAIEESLDPEKSDELLTTDETPTYDDTVEAAKDSSSLNHTAILEVIKKTVEDKIQTLLAEELEKCDDYIKTEVAKKLNEEIKRQTDDFLKELTSEAA